MISDPKYNFVFVEIPKTAGTSMRARLFRMGCADVNNQKHADVKYKYAQHYNMREYRQILGASLDSRFKFAFVRNPWERLVSSFTRECTNWRNSSMKRDWALDPERFQEWAPTALKPGRRAASRRYPHYLSRASRIIAATQSSFLKGAEVDFIGRFENVVEDFGELLNKIDAIHPLPPRKYWLLPKHNVSHGADAHYSHYYNDETRKLVEEVYAEDINRFGYKH